MVSDITMTSAFDPEGIRLGVVRGISYGLFGGPGEFIPQARALGARLVRAYLYWGQVEPGPGRYRWDAVDALLGQVDGDEEVWITLCSSSPWGTVVPTDFQPQSPALDQRAYAEFVRQVVRRCAGRVRYWQCNNEPSNTDLLWAGTAGEYIEQLKTFCRAVKDTDPAAAVVLGGCGYDVLSSQPGSPSRQFFDHLTAAGHDAFDLFSVGRLLGTDLPWTKMRQVYRLLGLACRYGPGPVDTACQRALDLDVINVTKIASMREKATENTPVPPRLSAAVTARFAR